jgi:hypothetical protein
MKGWIALKGSFWGGIHFDPLPNLYPFVPSIACCRLQDYFPSVTNCAVHHFSVHGGMIPNEDQECLVIHLNNGQNKRPIGAGILSKLGIHGSCQPLDFRWCVGCEARPVRRLLLVSIITFVSFNRALTVHAGLRSRSPPLITRNLIPCANGIIEAVFQLFLSCLETF